MSSDHPKAKHSQKLQSLIAAGSDIAGGAIGGALGFLAAGPVGAAAGGAGGAIAAEVIKKLGTDAAERMLGPRERVRIGAAIAIASEHIRARTERGERLREDGFFDQKPDGRSDSEEVSESVILKAQKEAEEKKIQYISYFIGNIAFDNNISAGLAHHIIKSFESMTYRQLCIIKMVALKRNFILRKEDYRGQGVFSRQLYEVLYECLDLYTRGYINFGGEVAFGPSDVKPASMQLQGVGNDIFHQMGLATIPTEDIIPIARVLAA
ncbi:MAG: hypothetical protein IOC35_03890 [Methylobacterium sp.]|nr:hypothetical protein [Methylobacterium sp.]